MGRIRQHALRGAKLAKDDIEARKRQILADADATLSREFRDQDEAWAEIMAEARDYMAEVQAKLAAICAEKNIWGGISYPSTAHAAHAPSGSHAFSSWSTHWPSGSSTSHPPGAANSRR
jgi:hypothetical protein